jgi:RHS repeat-associated protein
MDELVVSWSPITGAEEYELEWTYVDDYTNGSVTSTIAAGAIAYDFKYNSTRISTTGFNYKINLVYERGYIIYRVRGVGRKLSNIATVIYGTWSITPDIGTGLTSLACGTSSYYYCLGHKTAFNWQYSSTFAEEGKKKEVVGYYDGGLRNRQTVTKINTTDTAIVGESFYDFQGRKAIDALPVPAQSPALTYYPNFNKNLSLTKYSRDDFDKDVTGQPCNVNTGGMSPTTGASRYYSNLNTNSSYQQTFLPDAQNYPFNQVEYTPDNTGRIRKMGGVGPTHQLGNNKETKYYYGRPLQEELDRLFGAEVGYDRHYKKNVVVDPNGQVSISYLDQEGHVIATALSGNAPDNVSGIPGESTALTSFNVDFFNKNPDGSSYLNAKNIDETALIFNTQYLVSTPGQTHSFDYSLTPQVVTDSCLLESICFDCIYDLELVIKDECGNIVYSKFARVGNLTLDNTCGTVSYIPSAPVPFTIPNMAIGNYQISKILTVNRNAYDYYLSQYLDASKNTCFKSYETLLEEEQIALADVECEDNCESCIASLGTSDNYVLTGKGSYEDWLREYNSCLEECKNPSLCEQIYNTMLVDMMPGGQYAQWYDSLELNGFNSDKFPLSILNYNNQLPDGGLVSTVSTAAFWKNPQCLRNNGSTAAGYFEPDGIKRSKIPIIPVAGGYFPAISTSTEDEIINGVKYIYPEHLLYAKDFVTYWQESWAKSLVIYHPEYCYRKWCVINLSDTATSALKSSEDFDNELLTTTSYADAVAKGFISTTVHNAIALADPYFTSVADGISFASQMNTELISNFDGSSMSMKAMAALITKCPAYYGTLSGVTSTCTSFLATGNPIIDDEVWKKYVSFYLSAKQKLIKLAADNYTINTAGSSCGKGYNGCIGADNFNPFASAFNRYLSLGSFASNLYTQPCSWSTYMLYKGKIPRFTIGAEIIKVDEDKAKFNMYYKTGLCPAESDLAMLLHSVTDKGNLLTSFSLQSESAFTKLVYDKIVSSIASPPSGFVEFTWTPVVNTSDPRLLEISFAYSGSPSPTCFINLKLPSTSYSWSMVKDITNIKVGTYNPYTGNSGFVFNAMIDDDANPATPNILVKITGTTCLKLGDCQFYDQCKTSDFGSRLLTLMSALAYNNQLSSISATVINLETSYPNFLNRYLRNALTSSSNNNLRWVQPNSTIANFKLYDISSTGSSQNVEVSFNSFTPSFAISDLYKIKYFTDLTVDDVDVSHGFYVTAWYETSPGVYATVRIQGDISLGSMATCKGPVPVECETKENQAASDLEDLLKNIFSTTPAVSSSLSSNNKYTELLESYIGSGHHTNFENIVANTIEFKADIQMYSSTSTIANTCNFRLFHYNDDWKDDFSTITSVQDLVADDAMKIGDKTYYFKLTVNYANGIQEVVGGYTTCIPIRSCKCESTAEVGGTGSCSDLAKLVMDGITKYNLNIFGNNPSSSFTIPQITESDYNCNCGAGYIDYYLSKVEMTGTSEMPMTYQEYVIFSCEDATASCPEYVNYFNAVTTFNKAHPSAPITIEPISSFTCDCISAYVDYINSFKLTPLPYALPPMSIADFQTGGCLPPSSGGDGCASYGKNYYDMAQNAIDLYNASHTPTIPNLNPYSSYLNPCECFLKYAIYLSGSTPNYPSPPKSFDEFVTQGCVDNDCWIAYYNMIDHLHNAAILAGNVPPYDPPAYDQSMCACYLGYSWYVRSHYGIGMMSLEDYCNSVSSSMRMAQTNSGEFQNEEVETGGENQKKKIIKSDEIKVDKLDTAILVARSSYVSTFVDNTRNLTYRDACPLDTLISPTDTLENPCRIFKANQAIYNAKKRYNDQVLAMTSFFREKYYNKCLSLSETLTGNVPMKDYHYTLYYYDQAGSLVATVPPAGVKLIDLATYGSNIKNDRWNKTQTVYNSHFLKTTYEYNSLNQLRRQSVPDNDKMDVWQVENSGGDITSSITVTDIQFVDGNLGYSIGKDGSGNGYMYKTIDGGLTWKRFDAKSADIKKIKMINTTDGFAVGNDGLFLRTTDGGINWQYIMINASGIGIVSNHLNDLIVEVVSGNTNVLVGGNEGALVKCVLASGAWTFTNVSASPLTSSMNILAMSADVYGSTPTLGKIYLTINIPAASTNINRIFTVTSLWSSVTITDINIATKLKAADLKAVYLYSSTSGYAAGVNGTLLKTTDGGINWIHVATNTIVNFNKLYFKDVTYGIALADDGYLYATSNAGNNWKQVSTIGVYKDFSMYDKTNGKGYAVGNSGLMAVIDFAGYSTNKLVKKLINPIILSDDFGAVAAVNVSDVFMASATGNKIYKAVINGDKASYTNIGTIGSIAGFKAAAFTTATKGALLTNTGKVYNCIYSGSYSFTDITISASTYSDISIKSSGELYALNSASTSQLHSSNAGWTSLSTVAGTTISPVNAIYIKSTNVLVVGNTGTVLEHTGASFIDNSLKTDPLILRDIYAVNTTASTSTNTAFAVGDDGTVIKTIDAGVTWQTLNSATASQLNAVALENTTTGIAVGNNGTALKITSSGISSVTSGTKNNLYDACYNSSVPRYTIAGQNKTVMQTTNSGASYTTLSATGSNSATIYTIGDVGSNISLAGSNGYVNRYNSSWYNCYKMPYSLTAININKANGQGMIVGNNNTTLYTNDRGYTWTLNKPYKLTSTSSTIYNFTGVAVWSSTKIYTSATCNVTFTPFLFNNLQASSKSDYTGLGANQIWNDVQIGENGIGYICGNALNYYKFNAVSGTPLACIAGTSAGLSSADLLSVSINYNQVFFVGTLKTFFNVNDITITTPSITNLSSNLPSSVSSSATLNRYVAYDKTNGIILGDNGVVVRVWDNNGSLTSDDKTSFNNNGTAVTYNLSAVDYSTRNHAIFAGASGHIKNLETEKQFTSLFWYDKLGRMVVSQNTKQYNKTTKAYSYTQYDDLGRITEVGEIAQTNSINQQYANRQLDDALFATWISGGARTEVTQTWYDVQFAPGGTLIQINLRKRVASVTYEDTYDGNSATYQSATHYSYDIHGNVNHMAQEIKEAKLVATGLNIKYIDYDYDLVSGKVNKVSYNPGKKDQYYHRYEYDADNRITQVFTSRDNIWWDNDAKYKYYNHGPMARTVIGDIEVQGLDYAYTLHGWLKGVNSNTLQPDRDMGKDGNPGSTRQFVARDAMGFTLGYYSGDYQSTKSMSTTQNFEAQTTSSDLLAARNDLYNGNISSMVTAMPDVSTYNTSRTITPSVRGGAYKYDQLNRLIEARSFFNVTIASNTWQSTGGSPPVDYLENFTYDAMGNIKHVNRWGNGGVQMDNMDYKYNTNTAGDLLSNKLYAVDEQVADGNYTDDIDDQVRTPNSPWNNKVSEVNKYNNYRYDELGNLMRDSAEGIQNIEWNVYGKIKKVTRYSASAKPDLEFIYDAGGNRVCKIIKPKPLNCNTYKYSYYLRDAQGNEMAHYELKTNSACNHDTLFVTEHAIYGSSRLGVDNRRAILYNGADVSADTTTTTYRRLGFKSYELSNHLGNVLVTISDKKIPKRLTGGIGAIDYFNPDINTITDYYAFGSPMPTRTWSDPNSKYKYGFNGKEKDNETTVEGGDYDFGARIYDSRLGRWLSLDPLMNLYPDINPYCFVMNRPTQLVDPSGREPVPIGVTSLAETMTALRKVTYKYNAWISIPSCPYFACVEKTRGIESYVELSAYFGSNYFGLDNGTGNSKRYLYSKKWGWIDLKHVAAAAQSADITSTQIALRLGEDVENRQENKEWPNNNKNSEKSAWDYEDLVSNLIGVGFQKYMQTPAAKGKDILTNLENYLTDLGFTSDPNEVGSDGASPMSKLSQDYNSETHDPNYTYDPVDTLDKDKRNNTTDKSVLEIQKKREVTTGKNIREHIRDRNLQNKVEDHTY